MGASPWVGQQSYLLRGQERVRGSECGEGLWDVLLDGFNRGSTEQGGGDWQERGDELRQASPMGSNQRLLGKPRGGRGKAGQVGGMSRSTLEV